MPGSDYGIFLLWVATRKPGRPAKAVEQAYYTAYRSVASVIIGSGLTIAGACYCAEPCATGLFPHHGSRGRHQHAVHHQRRPYTEAPAIQTLGGLFGLFDPKRAGKIAAVPPYRHKRGCAGPADIRGQFVPVVMVGADLCARPTR